MRLRMLWYQFRMLTIRDGVKRTEKTECICRYWRECDDSVS